MKLRQPLAAAAVLALASSGVTALAGSADDEPGVILGAIATGKTTLYHTQNGVPRTDLSGAATDGTSIVFGDDGGDAGAGYGFNFVRVTSNLPDTDGYNVPLSLVHNDVEGAAFTGGKFYITTSFSDRTDANNRRLTRFDLDNANHRILNEESVDVHDSLREALRANFGDEWYDSWKNLPAKSGGLNIEGLSRSGAGNDRVVFGLRSPLFGGTFPSNLHSGNAILAEIKNPFSANPTYDFIAVDLGGLGVRGMAWIPSLNSYVISAGPVEKATEYSLHQVFLDGSVRPLALPGMDQLCRPESVFQQTIGAKDYLVVVSEDSGPECAGVPFTWIRAEIKNPAWTSTASYNNGDLVTRNGSLWQASWWTQNQQPGDPWGPWQEIATAADGTAIWTASRIFFANDVAAYNGQKYRAKWWTRNQAPGDPYGPWELIP
jgi:hypothetical protein